ncbi:MAG: acyltransferase [Gammaproteobacteria bacterium]|nr:acyltransferase [Gammaproteobacteria bacterium]
MANKNYIEPLTWLRGIAALLVIFSHSLRASNVVYTPTDVAADVSFFRAMDLGDIGVTIFFVLSGLTLYLSNSHLQNARDAAGFYLKRFFRIWPAFAVALLAYIAFNTYFTSQYHGPTQYWINQHLKPFDITDILHYLSLTFNFTGPTGLFSGALWSLPVEFQYYLAFPLALWLARRFGAILLIVLGGAYLVIGGHALFPAASQSMFLMGYSFFGGMYIGKTTQAWKSRIHWSLAVAATVCLLVAASLIQNKLLALPQIPFFNSDRNFNILASLAIVLLIYKADFSATPEWLRRALKKYGDISYSTYLFHQLFIGTSVLLFINFGITGDIKPWFTLILTVGATLVVASLTYRFIEKPGIAYAHRLVSKR